MSPVRYEKRNVDLTGVKTSDEFEARVNAAVGAALENVVGDDEPPQLLSLHLNLIGATALCGRINSLTQTLNELERSRGGVRARINKHINLTLPAIDLDELSRRNDPAGALARTLIALERNEEDESLAALVREAAVRLQEVYRASAYVALVDRHPMPDRETARQILLQQGRQLLEALRAQLPEPQEALA
jgi:hypothetical protein